MEQLLDALARWKPFTAVVVGDFILDELVYGDAERLSPDAPVPVLLVKKREVRPGGAANVCMDLAALRGSVRAVGVTGDDRAGTLLRGALERDGVDVRGLVTDAQRPTTLKQNLIGLAQSRHPQKMFRVDEESREPVSEGVEAALLRAFDAALAGADCVILEDYAKGVCSPSLCAGVIARAKRAGVPVLVDPARGVDVARYRGATTITPNRTEAEQATGITGSGEDQARTEAMARTLLERAELECVVLTLDKQGALLLERGAAGGNGACVRVPTLAREVYDVSGAGDMFLAGLAAARANGCSWEDSVRFANAGAGLEVEVFGVQPIPFEQVRDSLLRQAGRESGKLRTLEQARAEATDQRRRGKRVVFTNGCFDVLHSGHVSLLERAAAEGDFLVVGLNDDASVRRLKGPTRPVNTQEDRARVLGALGCVGAVVLFSEDTPLSLIETLRPDVLVKGADYTKDRVVGAPLVESYGGRVALIPLVEGRSTSAVIEKMRGTGH